MSRIAQSLDDHAGKFSQPAPEASKGRDFSLAEEGPGWPPADGCILKFLDLGHQRMLLLR